MDIERIRNDFPIFKRFKKEGIIYLDNAATTQKPMSVIDSMVSYWENYNSNVHRGVYRLGEESTELYSKSRKNIANFIGARAENLIFVRNATEALNLGAYGLTKLSGGKGEVLLSRMEHHSNIVPWQIQKQNGGLDIKFIENSQ